MRNLPLHARDLRGRGVEQLFGLARVECGRDAAFAAQLCQPKAIRRDVARAFRDPQLPIERLQKKIGIRDVGDQGRDDGATSFFGREILRARRLVQASQAPPDIEFPCDAKSRLEIRNIRTQRGWQWPRANFRESGVRDCCGSDDNRKLVCSYDSEAFASLQHAFGRDLHIEVPGQGRSHEPCQRLVLEEIEPLHVAERCGLRRLIRRGPVTKRRWHRNRRPVIVRAKRARRGRQRERNNDD